MRVEQKREGHRPSNRRRARPGTGAALRSSADHRRAGDAALELLTDVPDLDALLAPIGGGGLISGCSIAAHALRPGLRNYRRRAGYSQTTPIYRCKWTNVFRPPQSAFRRGWLAADHAGRSYFCHMRQQS